MTRNLAYRMAAVIGAAVLALFYLLPTILAGHLPSAWPGWLPSEPVRLGLDLRGGMHLILEVQTERAVEYTLDRMADDLKRQLLEQRVPFRRIHRVDSRLEVQVPGTGNPATVAETVMEQFPTLESVEQEEGTVRFRLAQEERRRIHEFAVQQSLETIRNRVDQLGLSEPIIQRSGNDAILVQLPGETNPEHAKSIIGKTAVLEFQLLPADRTLATVLEGEDPCRMSEPARSRALARADDRAPAGLEVLCGREPEGAARTSAQGYLVEEKILMTGEVITDARPRPDTTVPGNYLVEIEFNSRGARLFENITAESVGRQLAIVLDDTVYSAPRIQERIGGGRAVITGAFSLREARDLAIVLRAGALPAPVRIAEERTVGPSLGRDSIRQGAWSFAVGGALVVLAMLLYYRGAGVLADAALVLNVVCVLGVLVGFNATLTLPGIAGIVLTLGMAVDANVLILERIREELRLGKTVRAAVDAGYSRALPAILDSNATTFLSGLILFQFGSGPIRGFAVTLCIGILTTVFTAVFCTRVVYDYLFTARPMRTISV